MTNEAVFKPEADFSAVDFTPVDPAVIRQQTVPWTAYGRLVDDNTVQLMIKFDKQPESSQERLLSKGKVEYGTAFVALLNNLHSQDALQYILTLINDILTTDPERVDLFHSLAARGADPYTPLLRLLNRNNWYILRTAMDILSVLFSTPDVTIPRALQDGLVIWLVKLLQASNVPEYVLPSCILATGRVLRIQANRVTFAKAMGINALTPLLSKHENAQLLYNVCFCLWLLSYNPEAVSFMNAPGLLRSLVELCKSAPKEKVIRVTLATLKNIVSVGQFNSDLVDLGLLRAVQLLSNKKWADDDIVEDLTYLSDSLQLQVRELSTYEKYQMEVSGGHLDWTPVHTNDQFWIENINKFEGKDFEIVRVLVQYLRHETPSTALCVALNDLGEFAKHHARGKKILSDLHAKERIMDLLAHEDAKVRKHALLCIQKLLVTKFQFARK